MMKKLKAAAGMACLCMVFAAALPCKGQHSGIHNNAALGAQQQPPLKDAASQRTSDESYFTRLALTDLKEIEIGKLAQQQRPGTASGSFGAVLEQDHRKSSNELAALARRAKVALPTAVDAGGAQQLAALGALEGEEFDRQFASMMVDGHRQALALLKEAASKAGDAELKAWAGKKIPVIEAHLGHAEHLKRNAVGQ